jgi:hypothetical protein
LNEEKQQSREDEQVDLFENPAFWVDHWQGMPEWNQEDLTPLQTVYIHLATEEDRQEFMKLIRQTINPETKSLWYPAAEIGKVADVRWKTDEVVDPKYPVYVISKGRWESRQTSKALEIMGVPYNIVIEPQEYKRYASVINPDKILVLPFSELGQGSIPARNWVMEHSIDMGAERHWILDDNLQNFQRMFDNFKIPVESGVTFRACEDFTDRYTNVVLSGMNYEMFAPRKTQFPPFVRNTRIYSCILIDNSIFPEFKWRGRYNEDTDLSIRVLKAGYCTILFNAFLCKKTTTMTMTGGNTEELYEVDDDLLKGRMMMAQSLVEQHPDIVTITEKWGRPQHQVDYSRFKENKLALKPGINIQPEPDDYGMALRPRYE